MQSDSFIVWRYTASLMLQAYHFFPQTNAMNRLLLFNKPFQVLSQFTDRDRPNAPRDTLARFLNAPGYRAAGRLDYDSEGLLILTNDGGLQDQITNPKHKEWKTYWVQVEGEATPEMCRALEGGVKLKDGVTLPAHCKLLQIPTIWERNPAIRYRASVPDSWIELSICEGRNRQVRRMTAAVGFPTLRLIRRTIGPYSVEGLAPGEFIYVDPVALDSDSAKQVVDRRGNDIPNSHMQQTRLRSRSTGGKAKGRAPASTKAPHVGNVRKTRNPRTHSD